MFSPSSLRIANAELVVEAEPPASAGGMGGPLTWRYPLKGIAEAEAMLATVFKFKCKARGQVGLGGYRAVLTCFKTNIASCTYAY